MTLYSVYTACNFYPSFATLIPSAILLGFCAAPLWSSKAQYLTVSASHLAKLTNERVDTIVNRFFGIFFCVFQLNQILGNVISASVIGDGFPKFSSLEAATEEEINDKIEKCGMNQPPPGSNDACGEGALEKEEAYLLMVRIFHFDPIFPRIHFTLFVLI